MSIVRILAAVLFMSSLTTPHLGAMEQQPSASQLEIETEWKAVYDLDQQEIQDSFNKLKNESIHKMILRLVHAKKFDENIPGDVIGNVVDFLKQPYHYGVNKPVEYIHNDLFAQPCLEYTLQLLELFIGKPITALSLYYYQLTVLPESIGNLVDLTWLDLTRNQLVAVPESLGKLVNLKELRAAENQLKELPESIANLVNLKLLDLNGNDLTTIPESLGNLVNLKLLDLTDNDLTTIPESLDNLVNLELLDLRSNDLIEDSKKWLRQKFGRLGDNLKLD